MTRPDDRLPGSFGLGLTFAPARVVVLVRGEVDSASAPELASLLTGMTDRRHRSLVLDLSECDFIDSAGLRVIAESAEHLAWWDRTLSVRSPKGIVRRLLERSSAAVTFLDAPETARGASDVRPPVEVIRLTSASGRTRITSGPEPLPIPVADGIVDGSLRLVVALARALVGGADGASVSLRRHDRLATVAASDETVLAMDADQYATGEGPCVDASTAGRQFHTDSLESEDRWPAFAPQAHALGINAIVSSPLFVSDRAVGALNIYSRTASAFSPQDYDMASLFALEASSVLSGAAPSPGPSSGSVSLSEAFETHRERAENPPTMTDDFYG